MCALGLALSLAGCGGGGGCLLDSDCPSFQDVCLAGQCVPAGTMLDGGPRDASTPRDGGGGRDAGRDAGADAGAPDAGPACDDLSGTWVVGTPIGSCGLASSGYALSIAPSVGPCDVVAASNDPGQPAVDGALQVTGSAVFGTLSVGGDVAQDCTGVFAAPTLTLSCGGTCEIDLLRL